MQHLYEACSGLRQAFGIIGAQLHEDIEDQRAVNIREARAFDQLPMTVERRLREIVSVCFERGIVGTTEWFRIAWPGQEQHLCSSAYWVKRKRKSHTYEVVRGIEPISRFTRQTNKGELYANLAEAIEADLLG